MAFSLKKFLEGAVAQVNPFDKGKTYSTVVNRQPAQTPPPQKTPPPRIVGSTPTAQTPWGVAAKRQTIPQINTKNRYAQINAPSYGSGLSGLLNRAKDVVDANTAQDRFKRIQAGQPEVVIPVQQKAAQIAKPMAQTAAKPFQQFGNAVVELNKMAYLDLPKAVSAKVSGNKQAMANIEKDLNRRLGGKGTFGAGMPGGFDSLERGSKSFIQDPTKTKSMLGTGVQIGTTVAPVGKGFTLGKQVFTQPLKETGKTLLKATGANAALSSGGSAGMQIAENGKIDPRQLLQDTIMGTALGTGLPFVGGAAIKGAQAARQPIQNALNSLPSPIPLNQIGAVGKNVNDSLKDSIPTTAPTQPIFKQQVLQVAEPFDAPLAKTQAAPPQPPKPPTGTFDQGQLGAGVQKKTRFASKTIPESEYVTQPVKDITEQNAPLYTKKTERDGAIDAAGRLKTQGDRAFENNVNTSLGKKEGTISRQEAIDAQVYAAKLEESADDINISKASEIYDRLSAHYTAAGQVIQAAAMMSRRSPAGMRNYAQRQFAKAGVMVTPDIQQQLNKALTKLSKAAPDTDAQALALDEVLHTIAKNIPQTKADLFINTWRANLLTAPTTTLGGFIGGVDTFINRKLWTNPVGTLVDMATSLFTGKRSMTLAGGFTKGATKGVKTGLSKQYWKTGYDEIDTLAKQGKYDNARNINFGDTKGGRAMGGYVNSVYRTMGLVDKPWKYGAQREALQSLAKAEGINQGFKGKQLKQFINEFIDNPPDEALNRSFQEGKYSVFQDETALGDAAGLVSNGFRRKGWNKAAAIVDFIVPFKQIPGSIATRIVRRTPIGAAQNIVKQIVTVKKGGQFDQRAFSQALAEGSSGIPIIAAGYAFAQSGLITGGYPSDEQERKLWQAEGKQPNSVKVGNRWYSLNYIQPFGALLNIGAGASQADKDGRNGMDIVWAGLAEGGKSVANMSFLQGLSGSIEAIQKPEMAAERFVQNTASSLVPNFVRSFAGATDPYERQASGVAQGVQSAIPGIRQLLPTKKDAYGQDVRTKDNFLNRYINPLKPSIAKNDEMTAELRRLKDADLGTLPSSLNKNALGPDIQLDKTQLNSLNAEVAKEVTALWRNTINSPEYLGATDEDKKKMLKNVRSGTTDAIKARWAEQNGLTDKFTASKYPTNLTNDAKDILNTEMRFTDIQRKEWGAKPSDNTLVKNTLKSWMNGVDVPVSNDIAVEWAKYEQKRLKNGFTPLEQNEEKVKILKKAVSSTLSDAEKKYYSVSDSKLLNALQNNWITPDSLAKAMDVDSQLLKLGLITTSGFGKKVWNAIGLPYPNVKGASGGARGGARSSGRRTAKKSGSPKLKFSVSNTKVKNRQKAVNSSLRKLLGSAKV